ncbi:hypothetical protein ACFWPU_15355 [Streptomyces sp. NPDC058471]|uniref:hypothetical protein n=1 Tax=Streptomyces sp. NPDC058471 TaxID=3346516 RepID=UPI0036616EDA
MDPAAVVSAFPGAERMSEVPDAWHWSVAPGSHAAAVLSADGGHLFQVNSRDSYDEGLVRALLLTAREKSAELLAGDAPLRAVPGFQYEGRTFDVLAAARPGVHRYHEVKEPELQQITWAIFPGYACEFAGPNLYSMEDARESFIRFLRPADLNRDAVPYIRLWFDNTVTGGGTDNPDGILAKWMTLDRELKLLDGAPGSFVTFQTFRGKKFRVEWEGGDWLLSGEPGKDEPRRLGLDEVLALAESVLHG